MSTRAGRLLAAFGHFWWDFLIGDTPEFALATLVIIGLALALHHQRLAATILLPLLTAAFLLASTYRGRRRPAPAPTTQSAGGSDGQPQEGAP